VARSEWFPRLPIFQGARAPAGDPRSMWIRMPDSRVPANERWISQRGELFVIGNVANLAPPQEPQLPLGDAVPPSTCCRFTHIMVVGHYGWVEE